MNRNVQARTRRALQIRCSERSRQQSSEEDRTCVERRTCYGARENELVSGDLCEQCPRYVSVGGRATLPDTAAELGRNRRALAAKALLAKAHRPVSAAYS